jgi:hypothetical protein
MLPAAASAPYSGAALQPSKQILQRRPVFGHTEDVVCLGIIVLHLYICHYVA